MQPVYRDDEDGVRFLETVEAAICPNDGRHCSALGSVPS